MQNFREQIHQAACPTIQARPAEGAGEDKPSGDSPQVVAWIQAARQGNRQAMEDLLRHFQDRVWRRARYRIGDPDEAWEVAQEVFLICFRKLDQFRGESNFWTWLARIVDNQVRNRQGWWRRRRQNVTFSMHDLLRGEDEEETEWDPPDPSPSPRQEVAGREMLTALEGTLQGLSAEHREILLLRFADNQSYEEIAETLHISLGTVKSRINRARQELRERMKDFL